MANSPTRTNAGVNRSALRNTGSSASNRPRAAVPLPAATLVRHGPPPESDFAYFLKTVMRMSGGLLGLLAVYTMGWLMHDTMAAGNALAEAKKERSTLVCQSGHMSHGDGSLHDLVFAPSYFVCSDWKTLQAVEMDEKPNTSTGATKALQ